MDPYKNPSAYNFISRVYLPEIGEVSSKEKPILKELKGPKFSEETALKSPKFNSFRFESLVSSSLSIPQNKCTRESVNLLMVMGATVSASI